MAKKPSIIFGAVGDIGFHRTIGDAMLANGAGWPFEKMQPHLSRAALLFGNMESVALPPGFPADRIDPDGLISRMSGPACAAALKQAGFDVMNMAANHVLDAGTSGMFHTAQCLRDAGLVVGGVGRTQEEARQMQLVEKNGITFGFLCYCEDNNYTLCTTGPCHAYYDVDTVIEDVKRNRGRADIIVVSLHADIEFMETPSVPRMVNSHLIAEAGADIILAHHPHVPQGIEMHGKCLIAYSLGNFVFDSHSMEYMRKHGPRTAHSFLLLMDVGADGVRSFERVPVVVPEPPEERPWPADGAMRNGLLDYFTALDGMLRDEETVRRNWSSAAKRILAAELAMIGASCDADEFIRALLPRMMLVAENRSAMGEVCRMARAGWDEFTRGDNTYARPAYRLKKKSTP